MQHHPTHNLASSVHNPLRVVSVALAACSLPLVITRYLKLEIEKQSRCKLSSCTRPAYYFRSSCQRCWYRGQNRGVLSSYSWPLSVDFLLLSDCRLLQKATTKKSNLFSIRYRYILILYSLAMCQITLILQGVQSTN